MNSSSSSGGVTGSRAWPQSLRIGALIVCALLALAMFPAVGEPEQWILRMSSGRQRKITSALATDDVRKAIDYRVELSKTLFNTTLLALGGLWSIVLAKKGEAAVVFHDGIAIGLLCCANVLLFSAAWEHISYVMDMSSVLAAIPSKGGHVPDIDATYVTASLLAQLIRIFAAILVSALTLLCAKWG